MDRNTMRKVVYVIAGAYLIYLAWQLIHGMGEVEYSALLLVFAVFFAIMGVVLIGWGARGLYKEYFPGDIGSTDAEQDENAAEDTLQNEGDAVMNAEPEADAVENVVQSEDAPVMDAQLEADAEQEDGQEE
ncbi:MAG: hypothetical protein LUH07_09220 [Lachnospiraceae bacterium]|nr:hypothetical protein [Lachnospiraceae bacterium]